MRELRSDFVHKFIPRKRFGRGSLLLLHQSGGNEDSLLKIGHEIAPNCALLGVRGRVQENGANRFYRKKNDLYDTEEQIIRTNELADWLESAKIDYDLQKVIAFGYSNGANMAATLLLIRPKVIAGALLFRPALPLMPSRMPDLSGKHIFISAGTEDRMVGKDETQSLIAILKEAGGDLRVFWQSGGHELHKQEIDSAKRWFEEKL